MQFYSIGENGVLYKKEKLKFHEKDVYIIDDMKQIYLWIGKKASDKKKRFSKRRITDINQKREKASEIIEILQGKEYGSFLAMIDILKTGTKSKKDQFDRPELEIEYEETVELINAGIDPDFEAKITLAAQELKLKNLSYEELCERLAKIQLNLIKSDIKITEKQIEKKTKEIFKSSSTYDELCWLIAELSDLKDKMESK